MCGRAESIDQNPGRADAGELWREVDRDGRPFRLMGWLKETLEERMVEGSIKGMQMRNVTAVRCDMVRHWALPVIRLDLGIGRTTSTVGRSQLASQQARPLFPWMKPLILGHLT